MPRPRAVDSSFPEFPIARDTDTPAWVGLQMPLFSKGLIYKLFKNKKIIPSPSLIENQKVRAKIRFGFKVKGSSQLAVICTCLRMETQHLSLQTRFVQNTLMSQNDVSNNIECQIGLKQQLNMLSTWKILV